MKCVFFDFETTGKNPHYVEIVALSAVCNNDEFDAWAVKPAGKISPGASRVNGFTKRRGKLYCRGERVINPWTPKQALEEFLQFIEDVTDYYGEEVQLIAHNGFDYDSWVLCRNLVKYDIPIPEVVMNHCTFNDSLSLARTVEYPGYTGKYKKGLGLNDMMFKYLDRTQNAVHDALNDALDCRQLVRALANEVGESRNKFVRRVEGISFQDRYFDCQDDDDSSSQGSYY